MNKDKIIFFVLVLVFLAPTPVVAQDEPKVVPEEESAEVFLEEYTDEFQEKFFEALKQKSIQNYDRAANLFLECKQLDPSNDAIDHELAKTYLLDKKYVLAQSYAKEALISSPENFWYLHALLTSLEMQSGSIETEKDNIPFENKKLRQNLALIYFQKRRFNNALEVLNGLQPSVFKTTLSQKINDSLSAVQSKPDGISNNKEVIELDNHDARLEEFQKRVEGLLNSEDYKKSAEIALEAIESYPLQPYFYYVNGLSLQRLGKSDEALEILETALDFLLDDDVLANKIYEALVDAYNALGNTPKANIYLNKMKKGS